MNLGGAGQGQGQCLAEAGAMTSTAGMLTVLSAICGSELGL